MNRQALFRTILALALVPLSAPQSPRDAPARPASGTALITGIVRADDAAGRPVRLARVTLNTGDGALGRTATTDDQGRFAFRNLPAGRFGLRATKAAWLSAAYGAKRPGGQGTAILLVEGQQLTDITMRMARGAVITGTVRDQTGGPVAGASVGILKYGLGFSGSRELGVAWSGQTDDLGVYRAFGLPPGDFVAVATLRVASMSTAVLDFRATAPGDVERALQSARQGGAPSGGATSTPAAPRPPASPAVSFTPVFYPGTTSVESAVTVTLAAGEERADIDIPLQLVPTARVEGVVTVPQGVPPESVQLTLVGSGPRLPAGYAGLGGARAGKDGQFSFVSVAPGRYVVNAQATWVPPATDGPATPAPAQPRTLRFWAQGEVDVSGHDVIVPLTLQPAMTISGRLAFEGPADPKSLTFLLEKIGEGLPIPPTRPPGADGQFVFTGLLPGQYRVSYSGGSGGAWFLKSALARGRETLDALLDVRPAEDLSDWVVTFTSQPSELGGTLTDTSGRAAPDYFIIVFTTEKTYWTPLSRRVQQTRPDINGRFSVKNLPAGTYLIAALTDVEFGEWYVPSFLESLAAGAVKVTIADGQKTVQDLKISGVGIPGYRDIWLSGHLAIGRPRAK
jgi:hypothetical protein